MALRELFRIPSPLRRTQSVSRCIDRSGQFLDLRIDITPVLLDQLTVQLDAGFEDSEIGVACVRLGRPEPYTQAAEDTLICPQDDLSVRERSDDNRKKHGRVDRCPDHSSKLATGKAPRIPDPHRSPVRHRRQTR